MMSENTFHGRLTVAMAHDGRQDFELAEDAQVSRHQLSKWKNGHVRPDLDSTMALVEALGISGHWLLTGEGPMSPDRQTDAVKLEVIGAVVNEQVDAESVRRFARYLREAEGPAAQRARTESLLSSLDERFLPPGQKPPQDTPAGPDDQPKGGEPPSTGNNRHLG